MSLAGESWGLRRHSGPPAHIPSCPPLLLLLLYPRNSHSHSLFVSNQFLLQFPISILCFSLTFPSPVFRDVRSNKQAEGFVLLNSGKSYLLAQYLAPKQRQSLDKQSQQLAPIMDYGSLPKTYLFSPGRALSPFSLLNLFLETIFHQNT